MCVTRYLLLPNDEDKFLSWARQAFDLELDAVHGDEHGLSHFERDPVLPAELPGPARPTTPSVLPTEYILRKRDWGLNDLESHDVASPVAQVLARLNADAAQQAGISPDDLISFERTRVVRFRRCGWLNDGKLHVGALQGSARPLRLQDPEVLAILRGLNRWLTRGATRVELPPEVRYRPRILARPEAQQWLLSGGVVHPWDA
jgi:hypothetical protein